MARIIKGDSSGQTDAREENLLEIDAAGRKSVEVPSSELISDATITREGQDLLLQTSNGESVLVKGYFSAEPPPVIESPDGSILSEKLVESFLVSSPQYAEVGSTTDESPVGAVEEVSGAATITRQDGTTEPVTQGMPVYKGDIVETSQDGAVNILFIDETSLAVSQNAKLAVDEYKFDPTTESGETNLSVLRGVFVFTSGLIGRDDPDDVLIETPVGSIGIRGTIIAGQINPGGDSQITVVEGAIVIKNGVDEITLAQQYESVRLGGFQDAMEALDVISPAEMKATYGSVQNVVPRLFSSINDTESETAAENQDTAQTEETVEQEATEENQQVNSEEVNAPAEAEALENPNPEVNIFDTILDPNLESGLGAEFKVEDQTAGLLSTTLSPPNENTPAQGDIPPAGTVFAAPYIAPPVINPVTTSQPLSVALGQNRLLEASKVDHVVTVLTANGDNASSATFTFTVGGSTISSDGYFQIVTTSAGQAEVRLTAAGATNLAGALVGTSFATFQITTTAGAQTIVSSSFNAVIQDAAVYLNSSTYGLDRDATTVTTGFTAKKIGDFDGDGNVDTVIANPSANTGNGSIDIGSGFFVANGTAAAQLGYSVDGIGDYNNDGYADVIAGAPGYNTNQGNVLLISGDDSSPNAVYEGVGATGDFKGKAVSGAGDFNGDGYSDFAFSAPGSDSGGTDTGSITVYSGQSQASLFSMNGHAANMNLGNMLSNIGDFNGDGLTDLLVSAENSVSGNYEAYLVMGGTSPTTSGGLDRISTVHEIVAIGSAGDFNADGYDDFAVSLDDGTDINTYVVFGAANPAALMDLAFLENPDNALKVVHSGVSGSSYKVVSLGDVNGDGFDDIQLGDPTGANTYIVHGNLNETSATGTVPYVTDGSATDYSTGADGVIAASGNDQSMVGNVNFIDNTSTGLSMIGGDGNNDFIIENTAFRKIKGGDGTDIIKFGTNGGNLDFSAVNFEKISQIEKIEFTGATQTIRLTTENLFNLLKSSDDGTLTIDGVASSTLQIDASSVTGATFVDQINNELGTTNTANAGYNIFEIGGYELYIDSAITVNVI